jgi:hypothetical protein
MQFEMWLVHEVDGEHAMRGVAQGAARADLLETAPALRQDAAADDQIQLIQRQLAVACAGRFDPGELSVEIGQIGQRPVGAEAETRDGVSDLAHGSSLPAPSGRRPYTPAYRAGRAPLPI